MGKEMEKVNLLFIFLGGAIGAIIRFKVSHLWNGKKKIPLGTLFANVTGGILLGALIKIHEITGFTESVWLLLATGFCGGYTTYSTFSYEVFELLNRKMWGAAALYLVSSILITITAVWFVLKI
jgi:CrcB protein